MRNKIIDRKIAVVAGAHRLPFLVADDLRAQGYDVFIIGLKNFCDPALNPDLWIRLGAAGTAFREAKKRGIKNLVMVGAIGHPNLTDIIPDFTAIKIVSRVRRNQNGYDSMLTALFSEIEKFGFKVLAGQDLCPSLTFSSGAQTKTKPNKKDAKDIERAINVSKVIGKLDIGQSVVVSGQVLAVEAAEGTKKMLERVIDIRHGYKKCGGVLAKMIKPGQDLRADIPAIGVETINAIADAKLSGIVVDSKNCWAIDKDEIIKTANKRKVFIIAK